MLLSKPRLPALVRIIKKVKEREEEPKTGEVEYTIYSLINIIYCV